MMLMKIANMATSMKQVRLLVQVPNASARVDDRTCRETGEKLKDVHAQLPVTHHCPK